MSLSNCNDYKKNDYEKKYLNKIMFVNYELRKLYKIMSPAYAPQLLNIQEYSFPQFEQTIIVRSLHCYNFLWHI